MFTTFHCSDHSVLKGLSSSCGYVLFSCAVRLLHAAVYKEMATGDDSSSEEYLSADEGNEEGSQTDRNIRYITVQTLLCIIGPIL